MYNTDLLINEIVSEIIPNNSKYKTMGFKIYLTDDFLEIDYNNKIYTIGIYDKNNKLYWSILYKDKKYFYEFDNDFDKLLSIIKKDNFEVF